MGYEIVSVSEGKASATMEVKKFHMASNGYVHAASIITLADTTCGYGCYAHLPEKSKSFTTIELKSNFLGSSKVGKILSCEAKLVHGGKTTQVWDATVMDGDTTIAIFRCTQMILYPKQ